MKIRILFIIISLINISDVSSQDLSSKYFSKNKKQWFFSAASGVQMSGIKDEDFIKSNYSPLIDFSVGKWFAPYLALQIGYKGFYFYTISDDIRHYYNYLYGEAIINFNNFVDPDRINRNWNLHLHGGPGYFYNHVYRKASLHINLGIQNTFRLTDHYHASIDISSIVGWGIYQGNEDILPGITVGAIYHFDVY